MTKIKLIGGLIVFSIFFVCFVSISIVSVIFLFSSVHHPSKKSYEITDGQVLVLNPLTNESSVGFVSINGQLNENEYIFYKDPHENHVLISNFGSTEYQCSGTCICESEGEARKSASTLVTRGIIYLVAALTSVVAYERAKEYFEQECTERMKSEESCTMTSSIRTILRDCERMMDERKGIVREKSEDPQIRRYFCKGICLTKKFQSDETRRIAEEFGCEKYKTEGEISVDCRSKHRPSVNNPGYLAIETFQKEILVPFCKRASEVRRWYEIPTKTSKYRRSKFVKLCVGNSSNKRTNPSIHCRLVFPEYKKEGVAKTNMKYW